MAEEKKPHRVTMPPLAPVRIPVDDRTAALIRLHRPHAPERKTP